MLYVNDVLAYVYGDVTVEVYVWGELFVRLTSWYKASEFIRYAEINHGKEKGIVRAIEVSDNTLVIEIKWED